MPKSRENESNKSKSQRTTVNLFIDNAVVNELKLEAETKGMSLNSHVNSVLSNYVSFYRRAKDLHGVFMTGNDFRKVLENLDEGIMAEQFKSNLTDLIPAALTERKILLTLQNLMEFEYKQMAVNAGIIYKFTSYHNEDGLLCLLFQHHFGIKWSRILSKGYAYQIETLFGMPTKSTLTHGNVKITILHRE